MKKPPSWFASRVLTIAFVATVWTVPARADAIVSPTAVLQNTLGTFAFIPPNSIDFTHDGSGVPAFDSGVTDFDAYMSANPIHAAFGPTNAWASLSGVLTGIIDYDLGGSYAISKIALWNQDEGARQGIGSFTIFTSTNPAFVGAFNAGSFVATDTSRAGQAFSLSPSFGQYVRLQINSNSGAPGVTTLGEIAFGGTATVPEATSSSLLGVGVLILASIMLPSFRTTGKPSMKRRGGENTNALDSLIESVLGG